MNKRVKIISLSGLFLFIALLLGPKVKFTESFEKATIPNDLSKLNSYLDESERNFPLEINAKKEIIWHEGERKSEYALVYIHGYTATKMEVYPIANNLAKSLNANLFYTRLKGHGIDERDAFKHLKVEDWLKDIDEAVKIGKMIGEKLILAGTSNGGAAVIWANSKYKNDILANILISPNIEPKDKKAKLIYYPWGRELAYLITGGYNQSFPQKSEKRLNLLKAKFFSTKVEQVDGIISLMGLVKLINRKSPKEYKTPTIIFHSYNDMVVDPSAINRFIKNYGGLIKDIPIISVEDINAHVPTGNLRYNSAQNTGQVTKYAVDFIKSLS